MYVTDKICSSVRQVLSRRIVRIIGVVIRYAAQAAVVQTLDSAIHRIKIYPMDSAVGFPNTYPLDSDLSGG